MTSAFVYLLAFALFVSPGAIVIRRLALSPAQRAVIAPGLSVAVVLPVVTLLGVASALQPLNVVALAAVANLGALRFPLTGLPFGAGDEAEPSTALLVPIAVFGVVAAVQAFRPALLHPFDAAALWAPLADEAARTGSIVPEWVPTMTKGISPSVALLAGPPSSIAGHLVDSLALVLHPLFAALAVLVSMLLARELTGGVTSAATTAFTLMMATPLLARSFVFHDDLVAGFFVSLAFYLALRASSPVGWVVVGLLAGAALTIKYLGVVVVVLVGLVLVVRRARRSAVLYALLGSIAALPWYGANLVRFGDPLFPFLRRAADMLDREQRFLIEQQEAFLSRSGFGNVLLTGRLALVLMGIGIVLGLAWLRRSGRRQGELAVALGGFLVVFLFVWNASGYGARHFLVAYPIYAAVAALGFTPLPSVDASLAFRRLRLPIRATTIVASLLALAVASLTVFNLVEERRGRPVAFDRQTGAEAVLRGKWVRVRLALEPPADVFASFGEVASIWRWLNTAGDPGAQVLSFDTRRYYIRQRLLAADDARALRMYWAGTAERQHEAFVRGGVGYIVATPFDARFAELYRVGPWRYLATRSDLYRLATSTRHFRVYEVVGAVGTD